MIIIGYQGIGKSTLANHHPLFVDLESSNFFIKDSESGIEKRDKNWVTYYCNIATHLSQQHKIVFVSSHKEVRDRLKKSSEFVIACVSDLSLRNEWVDKLYKRYIQSQLTKDYKAWKNAESYYCENIIDIMNDIPQILIIKSTNYNLQEMIVEYTKGLFTCNYF